MKTKQLVINPVSMTSLEIAELTGKEHRNVLRDIEAMFIALSADKEDCAELSSHRSSYKNTQNKSQPMYNLPKRETLILISGYSVELRSRIIDRMDYLEKENEQLKKDIAIQAQSRSDARLEYAPMTKALQAIRAEQGKPTEHFHYSNEANLIYLIVLGGTCKTVKEEYCLGNLDNLRDNLTPQQIASVQDIQKVNTALLEIGMNYEDRKAHLQKVFSRKWSKVLIEEHIRLEA